MICTSFLNNGLLYISSRDLGSIPHIFFFNTVSNGILNSILIFFRKIELGLHIASLTLINSQIIEIALCIFIFFISSSKLGISSEKTSLYPTNNCKLFVSTKYIFTPLNYHSLLFVYEQKIF